MNKRINQLAAKAWKEVYAETAIVGSENPAPSIDEVVMFEKKFAELIIRKCIAISKRADTVQPMTYTSIEISKHFGIEE